LDRIPVSFSNCNKMRLKSDTSVIACDALTGTPVAAPLPQLPRESTLRTPTVISDNSFFIFSFSFSASLSFVSSVLLCKEREWTRKKEQFSKKNVLANTNMNLEFDTKIYSACFIFNINCIHHMQLVCGSRTQVALRYNTESLSLSGTTFAGAIFSMCFWSRGRNFVLSRDSSGYCVFVLK
jgi:hypothetical protein